MGTELRISRQRPGVRRQALKRDTAFVRSWILNGIRHHSGRAFSVLLGIMSFSSLTKDVSTKPGGSGFSATALRDAIAPSTFHV